MAQKNRLIAQIGPDATYGNLLTGLASATWWIYAGHGFLPANQDSELNKGKAEEAQIGAVLELADGVVEDLDILLRCRSRDLQICILSACVSAGLNVSEGNEIAGFVRALKARGCGPIAVVFWEVRQKFAAPLVEILLRSIVDSNTVEFFQAIREAVRHVRVEKGLRQMSTAESYSGIFSVYV